jgi:sterol-4alpha-carboxylate 3-dehydrogenase (decarboxylating)
MELGGQQILIVGGAGLLGRHLIEDLLEKGVNADRIHAVDIKPSSRSGPSVSYHRVNIASQAEVDKAFQLIRPTVVFHLVSPYPFVSERAVLENVNINGTRNLIDSAQLTGGVLAFIYVSSSSVIHDHYRPLENADESYPVLYFPQQPNYYAHTKAVAEDMVLSANRKDGGMLTVALRPASMYGEGDLTQIPNLVKSAKAGRANLQIGPGKKFDNTYVKNLTHAQILAAEGLLNAQKAAPLSNDVRVEGETFFVIDDDPYTFPAYTRLVAQFAGHPVKKQDIRVIPVWLMLSLVYVIGWLYWICTFGKEMAFSTKVVRMLAQERTFNISKIKSRLGYRPRYTTAEGTKRAVEWYLAHEGQRDSDKKAQ